MLGGGGKLGLAVYELLKVLNAPQYFIENDWEIEIIRFINQHPDIKKIVEI